MELRRTALAAAACVVCCAAAATAAAVAPYKDSMTVVSGKAAVLPCSGDRENSELPTPNVSWYRRSKDGSTAAATGPGYTVWEDGSLLVDRVRPRDEARFMCKDNSTDRLLAVYDLMVRKPSMVRLESSADSGPLSEGDTFTLSCRVLTDSAAHAVNLLIWRDARLLSKEDPRVTLTTQRQRNRWRLSVANITRRDAGRYICRAKTYFDRAEATLDLTVAPRVVANCNSSSAELRWSALAPAPGGFRVQMSVDGAVKDEALVSGNRTSVEVFNLEPSSRVEFRVRAEEQGAVPGTDACVVPTEAAAVPTKQA